MSALEHVRPGDGFKPAFPLMQKGDVNGSNEQEIFSWLKASLPFPQDTDMDLISSASRITWSPIKRNDIAWNFEKFLLNTEGVPVHRYSHKFPVAQIKDDITALLKDSEAKSPL